jgi:trehalose-6-phosphate synthase
VKGGIQLKVRAKENFLRYNGHHISAGATVDIAKFEYDRVKDSVEVLEKTKPKSKTYSSKYTPKKYK